MKQTAIEALRYSKVYEIMENFPIARDSDKVGYILYLQQEACKTDEEKKIIFRILTDAKMTQASFARTRRYIQKELGELPPSPEVQENRVKRRDKIVEFIRENKTYSFMSNLFSIFSKKD